MIKTVNKDDIPGRGKRKSDWRLKAERDIKSLVDSDDEAIEFLDLLDAYDVKRRRATLIQVVKDLGIEDVKVIQRSGRLFVVKEDGFE